MPYVELPPPRLPGLACLWLHAVPAGGAPPVRILPDGCVDLIWQAGIGAHLAGPDTHANLARLEPGAVIVGARFSAGAGGAALGLPLSELRDARVPVPESRGLHAALDPTAALRAVARTASRLVAAGPPDRAISAAAARLSDPRQRVEALAGDLGLSERQLHRRCVAAVGYGPKLLQRVLRFRAFIAAAEAAGANADLGRLAHETGYADQAHLTRECTALSGLPPAALLKARLPAPAAAAAGAGTTGSPAPRPARVVSRRPRRR